MPRLMSIKCWQDIFQIYLYSFYIVTQLNNYNPCPGQFCYLLILNTKTAFSFLYLKYARPKKNKKKKLGGVRQIGWFIDQNRPTQVLGYEFLIVK